MHEASTWSCIEQRHLVELFIYLFIFHSKKESLHLNVEQSEGLTIILVGGYQVTTQQNCSHPSQSEPPMWVCYALKAGGGVSLFATSSYPTNDTPFPSPSLRLSVSASVWKPKTELRRGTDCLTTGASRGSHGGAVSLLRRGLAGFQ